MKDNRKKSVEQKWFFEKISKTHTFFTDRLR